VDQSRTLRESPAWIPAHRVLQELPLAAVFVARDGALRWSNGRFDELFDRASVERAHLADSSVAGTTHRLERNSGDACDVLVYRLPVEDGCLLVLDDTPGGGGEAEVARLRQRVSALEHDSLVDPLTGAWNRRYLEHVLPAELGRAERHRQPLAALMLDIDHFKRINDTHGHAAGDAVLRELAALVRGGVRASDALVRWGGEEFLLLMPHTTHRAAAVAAEKLRALVAAHAFARADAALYRAKGAGRNRVAADARGASDAWAAAEAGGPLRLVWQEDYACGEPAIDAEHRELFRLANLLIEASLCRDADRNGFLAALDACFAHVAAHFGNEERILAARGYAELEAHRAAHRGLLERAGALRYRALQGEADTGKLVEFLAQEVVVRHLLASDRKFFALFRPEA
jgi:hemerythrin-like metal-binding protein